MLSPILTSDVKGPGFAASSVFSSRPTAARRLTVVLVSISLVTRSVEHLFTCFWELTFFRENLDIVGIFFVIGLQSCFYMF